MRINVLAPETIEKIAAGEVVQRPGSVIKELIDNSIDAGASAITVELKGDDIPQLTVRDNGGGMSADELLLSVQRHTTSKIRTDEDLNAIATLGFRGEALASIAAVSKLSITTRRDQDSQGSLLEMPGGHVTTTAAPVGTKVTVSDLFYNTPARRKFLRARSTEIAAITETVQHLALAWPGIRFRLTNNNRTVLATPGNGRLIDAIAAIAGTDSARDMLEINWSQGNAVVSGCISHPRLHRSNRSWQYISVNRRPVQLRLAAAAVEKAYHTLLPRDRHPLMFLNLDIDPELVDVNVHPAKTEVKFSDSNAIYRLFLQAAQQALAADNSHQPPDQVEEEGEPLGADETIPFFPPMGPRSPQGGMRPSQISFTDTREQETTSQGWKVVGQVLSTYLVVDSGDGMVLVDQHAAQERVMYEKYTDMLEQGQRPSQLVLPLEVELPAHLLQFARGQQAQLSQLGFGFNISDSGIVLNEVPLVFRKALTTEDVVDILEHLMDGGAQVNLSDRSQAALMMMACKTALKARQQLSPTEARQLLDELNRCRNSTTCPHGRPTTVHISRQQLEKMFARR